MIHLALSSDARGHPYHATLIASILRRTSSPVHVRCWCRGFKPESFQTGRLTVEFIHTDEEVSGKFPLMVGPAVFDRLRVIRDAVDWDRCLIMDYDQLALCDLAPLFKLDLGDTLLAAKMQGPGVDMAYAMKTWIKRPFPAGWEHVAEYPYFSMGPLLNLTEMREAGTWDKLVAAHAAFGMDEQLSLTAATEGRTMGFDKKWNLFPATEIQGDDVPEGVIHWLGWPKPWHAGANVWRPDIWESEKSSWEHLRMGIWKKPLAIELNPEDDQSALALARRGWRVKVFANRFEAGENEAAGKIQPRFPDLETHGASVSEFQNELERERDEIDMVRIGAWEDPGDWLEGSCITPQYLVLRGGLEPEEVDRVRSLGYQDEARLMVGEWPAGGPMPRALDFSESIAGTGIKAGEELILRRGLEMPAECPPLSFGRKMGNPQPKNPKRVGVCILAEGDHCKKMEPLLRSIRKNFLPGHDVRVFLFSEETSNLVTDLEVIQITLPCSSRRLRRHELLCEHASLFDGIDYLFSLDVGMRVIGKVSEDILSPIVAVIHPGFHDQPREKFPYESRVDSTARVRPEDGSHYFSSGFQGGGKEEYLAAAHDIMRAIQADEKNGITAVWMDESHWNRYLAYQPPAVRLSPSYSWYADGRSAAFEAKISMAVNA